MPTSDQRALARRLVKEHGVTLCEAAGITLRDKPSPLWRLLYDESTSIELGELADAVLGG